MNQPATVSDRLAEDRIRLPGFAGLPQLPGPAHPDPPQTPGPGQATIPGPGPHPGPPAPDEDGPPSIPGSSTDGDGGGGKPDPVPAPFRARVKAFTKLAETGFEAIAGLLNKAAASDQAPEVFLPDDDDMAQVPPPIARLAARRVELPLDEDQLTDAQDVISAAIALGAWAVKGLVEFLSARRAAKRTIQGTAIHVDAEAAK